MPLEEYLIKADPYRSTVPYLDPLPCDVELIPDNHYLQSSVDKICAVVSEVLSNNDIRYHNIRILEYRGLVYGVKPVELLISIVCCSEVGYSWSGACQAIQDRLGGTFTTRLFHVQIHDPQKNFELQRHPIPDGEEGQQIMNSWSDIQESILVILRQQLQGPGAQWSTLCLFMCGRDQSSARPTAVVTIDGLYGSATHDWSGTRLKMLYIFQQKGLSNFDIEFTFGRIRSSAITTVSAETKNGDSIGIVGDPHSSGSIGGFVTLAHPSFPKPRLCAITCHHVIRTEDPENEASRQPVLQLAPGNVGTVTMRSPSECDFNDTMADLQAQLKSLENDIREAEEKLHRQDGFLIPREQKGLDNDRKASQGLRDEINMLQQKAPPFGQVIASSGLRKSKDNHKLDWALIEVDPDRFSVNIPPPSKELPNKMRSFPKAAPYKPVPGRPATKVEQMNPGDFVVMRGRATGVIGGEVHKIREVITSWETPGLDETTETIILGIRDERGKYLPIFSYPGDSGAWIFNKRGSLVGQQIAFQQASYIEETVATPIGVIFTDIEEVTGGRISIPKE